MKKIFFFELFYVYLPLLLILLGTGCNPRVWCARNYPPIPTIERIRVDSLVITPGATVYDTLIFNQKDTLFRERVIIDSTGRAQLRIFKDAYGRLIAACEAKPDTTIITNERVIIREAAAPIVAESKSFLEKASIYVSIAAIIMLIVKFFIK